MSVCLIRSVIDIETAIYNKGRDEAIEQCARIADQLAEAHEKDGKRQMALGSKMAAEAIRIFIPALPQKE